MIFFILHDEVFCIYYGKYHKFMIYRHDGVNIQLSVVLKKVLRKYRNTSSYPISCNADM